MLDENLRVLTRRLNDIEIDLADKKDKLRKLETANADKASELDDIYEKHSRDRLDLEKSMN